MKKNRKSRSTHQPCGLEALEHRSLFSAYLYNTAEDFFNLTEPIHTIPMPPGTEVSGFGQTVAALGDIDGDGFTDFAASATIGGIFVGGGGIVYLFSGRTASMIRSISDGAWEFGTSMAAVGDMNEDGVPDLLVGSPRYGADPIDNTGDPLGRAYVYSGADGSILRTLEGTTPSGDFGRVVARLVNGDGDSISDLVVGAPGALAELAGQVFIFAGADGSLLHTLSGAGAGDRFGAAIATGLGEGTTDADLLAIGAPFHDTSFQNAGRVYVFHTDGTLAYTLDGLSAGEEFGSALAIARVLGPLGIPESYNRLLVGAPASSIGLGFEQPVESRGRVDSYLLFTGLDRQSTEASDPVANARFGATLAIVRDLGGLGADNVLIGATGTGHAYAVDPFAASLDPGAQGRVVDPLASSVHGNRLAGVGDVNDDGIVDVISSDRSGVVTIVSSLALGRPLVITGSSSDLRYLWSEGGNGPVLFVDGVPRAYSHVPGLVQASLAEPGAATSHILAIGNDGAIVFINRYRDFFPDSELMFNVNGDVSTLQSQVVTFEGQGPPDFSSLFVVKAGSGGHILLAQGSPLTPSEVPASIWLFSGGVLTRLWNGFAYDVNATGTVVGTLVTDDVQPQAVVWSHDSGQTLIPELTGSLLISDNGAVVGTRAGTRTPSNPGTIATWVGGEVTDVVAGPEFPVNPFRPNVWTFRAIDDTGRILVDASAYEANGPTRAFTTYIYEPTTGLRTLRNATHRLGDDMFGTLPNTSGPGAGEPVQSPMALAPDGRVLSYGRILTQVRDSAIGVIREGSPVLTLNVPGLGDFITAINQYDEVVIFRASGSSTSVRRMSDQLVTAGNDNLGIFSSPRFTDPDGAPLGYVVLANLGYVQIFSLLPDQFNDGRFLSVNQGDTPIVSNLVTFVNAEGVPHVAGFDANGDLVINYMAGLGDWRYDNLSQNHFEPQGITTPTIVSRLTAYTTSWSGMNIAGLDAQGHVQVAWWAPGMMPWRLSDISASVLGPPVTFTGTITAFVTSWGTMHVTGADRITGVTTALWWAPGDGAQWRSSRVGNAQLNPQAFTSFVTPWSALNIASIDGDGQLFVQFWTPSQPFWASGHVILLGPDYPTSRLTGRLDSAVEVTPQRTTQSVVGRAEDGSMYRFSWSTDRGWFFENLTELIA